MANRYKTFSLGELKEIICEAALMAMRTPTVGEDASTENEMVAFYNDGIGTFAGVLIRTLEGDDDEEE